MVRYGDESGLHAEANPCAVREALLLLERGWKSRRVRSAKRGGVGECRIWRVGLHRLPIAIDGLASE